MYSEVLIQGEEAEAMEGVRFQNQQQQEQRSSLPSFRHPNTIPPTINDLQAQQERDRQQQALEQFNAPRDQQTQQLFENLNVREPPKSQMKSNYSGPNVIGNSHEVEDPSRHMSDNDLTQPLLQNAEEEKDEKPATKKRGPGRPRSKLR